MKMATSSPWGGIGLPIPWILSSFGALACLLLFLIHKWKASKEVLNRIRGPPSESLLIGSLLEYGGTEGRTAVRWHKEYGHIVRFKGFLQRDQLLISDPIAIAHIFASGPYTWERDTVTKPRFAVMFGAGLLSTLGETHKRLRKVMLPAFNSGQILALDPIFRKCAKELKGQWEARCNAGGELEGWAEVVLSEDILFATLNVVGLASFGYDFDGFNKGFNDPLLAALATVDQIANSRTYTQILLESIVDGLPASVLDLIFALPMRTGRELKKQLAVMHDTAAQLFQAGVDAAKSEAEDRRDLLSVLVKANLKKDGRLTMTDREVQDQVLTFIFAGWTAVLATLSEAFRQLAQHPTVQSTLRAELLALSSADSNGEKITPDQLLAAPYLDAFWRELLRFTEPTQLERVAMRDDVIPLERPVILEDGTKVYEIPVRKGQLTSFNVMAVNHDPIRFGSDANVFNVERWLTEQGDGQRTYRGLGPGAWDGLFNFGTGTRACPGTKYAILEVKLFLYYILTAFELSAGSTKYSIRVRSLGGAPSSVVA